MEEQLVNLIIAERPYRLKIDDSNIENIKKAEKIISEQVKKYGNSFKYRDKQDLLAMVVLHNVLNIINLEENKPKEEEEELVKRIERINNTLLEYLNKEQ